MSTVIINKLQELQNRFHPVTAFVGFDGYVDLIQKAVKSNEKGEKIFYDYLADLGAHISSAAGKSAQIELNTSIKKLGGNAPIMANALACLGIPNYCSGTMGDPIIHDVFKEMNPQCQLLSFADPAFSNAIEFEDGKLILSELSAFGSLDFKFIQQKKGDTYLDEALIKSQLISLVDWANLPLGTALWDQFFEHLNELQARNKIFFFDICDPSKKTTLEIKEILQVIGRYSTLGKSIVGLNENEARKVFYALQDGISSTEEKTGLFQDHDLKKIAEYIFNSIKVDALLVHPVDQTILVTDNKTFVATGKVIEHPKLLTGGGDNLNAGFCFGLLHGFNWEECMQIGMAASGAYVEQGRSPDISALIKFMEK